MRRFRPDLGLLLAAYALAVAAGIATLPLRITEILHLLGNIWHLPGGFLAWIRQTPYSAPLSYFVQFPFVWALGPTRFGARLPSLLFGLGSCYLFWQLARRIPLRWPYLALAVFALLPAHYISATQGLASEQALFLLLLATVFFFRLLDAPTVKAAVWYAAALTLSVYTVRFSVLPALGYLLFLFAFVIRAHERRVIWFALAPTIAPGLLFLPYYLWARQHGNPRWPYPPVTPGTPSSIYLQAVQQLAGGGLLGYALSTLLVIGSIAGVWGLLRAGPPAVSRTVRIVCMFGGALVTVLIVLGVDVWNRIAFTSDQVLWMMPGVVVSLFAALERFGQLRARRFWTWGAVAAVIALSVIRDIEYVATPSEDLAGETALIRPQLTGDSCVVFVSEGLSQPLFLVFDPGLEARVCREFFHHRAVLASHAYVRPAQQQNAESFFRGLNFTPIQRLQAGGGQIVIMQSASK